MPILMAWSHRRKATQSWVASLDKQRVQNNEKEEMQQIKPYHWKTSNKTKPKHKILGLAAILQTCVLHNGPKLLRKIIRRVKLIANNTQLSGRGRQRIMHRKAKGYFFSRNGDFAHIRHSK